MVWSSRSALVTSLWLWLILSLTVAAGSWGFDDATISVSGKKSGASGGLKEKLTQGKLLSKPIILGHSDTLKVLLTVKEDKKVKRPHQAFLCLEDTASKLDTSFVVSIKENGKGKVDITQKDLPHQFLKVQTPLKASIVIGSFGNTKPYDSPAFEVTIESDSPLPSPPREKSVRYGKLDEIHHQFRADPRSPSVLITLPFVVAVTAAVPALFGAVGGLSKLIMYTANSMGQWGMLGANVNHAPKAFGRAPIPYALFLSTIVAMEGTFFMYYKSWNLFQTLPTAIGIGLVAFLSGSRALREVQERRLAGLR